MVHTSCLSTYELNTAKLRITLSHEDPFPALIVQAILYCQLLTLYETWNILIPPGMYITDIDITNLQQVNMPYTVEEITCLADVNIKGKKAISTLKC